MLAEGATAPDFTLPDQDGHDVSLGSLRGRTVVLYFYPEAGSPGCTQQACAVRDHADDYTAAQAVVLGVSPDPPDALRAFRGQHGLGFTLLSDADHAVSRRFGTWSDAHGMRRATFLIDAEGTIVRVLPRVQPRSHDERVLRALVELGLA
jgi:peroxiredoxin Q/BCP